MKFEIKKIFNLTNKYIILATPLILFSLLSNLYALFSANGRIINLIFALLLLILMDYLQVMELNMNFMMQEKQIFQ